MRNLILCVVLSAIIASSAAQNVPEQRVQFKLDTSEADAVLTILETRNAGKTVSDADWQKLFSSEPYVRLKKREASLHRDFTD